jgi:copper homeostasis protein (lipoprotein)
MRTPNCLISCLFLLGLAGCHPDKGQEAAAPGAGEAGSADSGALAAQDSERTWAGLLPCRDCQGIDTRLVLRLEHGKHAYLMTETYLGGSGKTSFNRAGTWTEMQRTVDGEPQVTYVLDPERAAQKFALQPDGALEMLGADGRPPEQAVEYRLQRL